MTALVQFRALRQGSGAAAEREQEEVLRREGLEYTWGFPAAWHDPERRDALEHLRLLVNDELHPLFRDYNTEQPVSEEVFRIVRSMYAAEPVPLEARSEPGGPASEFWSIPNARRK